ncbi:MAG TPA: hypothetical protein PLL66_04675 [Bacteroidales bacterium]|nr:hypothetical protein [Bacteroidales bacterium]
MKPQEILISSSKKFWSKWVLAFKVIPALIIIGGLKYLAYYLGYEVMELNSLFTTLVAGTIFLLGFLISGVLSDYKESEKLPSEISASIRTMLDDTYTLYKVNNLEKAKEFASYQRDFLDDIVRWFYKKHDTNYILEKIKNMNEYIWYFEKEKVQVNYIIKLKSEHNTLRKYILRIDTIRETNFVSSAYTIVEFMTFLISFGLIITHIEPFYFGMFLSLLVTFLIVYMFYLIKDLDNPFDYSEKGETGTEIRLDPIHDLQNELHAEDLE